MPLSDWWRDVTGHFKTTKPVAVEAAAMRYPATMSFPVSFDQRAALIAALNAGVMAQLGQPEMNNSLTPIQPEAPVDTSPTVAQPQGPPMSWFSKFFIDPIEKAVGASQDTAPIIATAKATVATATQAVDPIFNEATSGVEAVVDSALSKAGIAGALGTPAANVFLNMLATELHTVINSKLGTPAAA